MKRKLFMCLLLLALAGTALGAIDYVYYGTVVPSDPTKELGGVALKSNGDLYYVTFDNPNSILAFVTNAIPGVKTSAYTVSTISTETGFTDAGRGLNDIDLDSAGNIYICGTAASGSPSVLKKFNAAPAHTLAWSQSISDVRINGIDVISADILAVGINFNALAWKNTSDGAQYAANSGVFGDLYGRTIALNTTNNDIYMGRNGNSTLDALKVIYGGSPINLGGYTSVLDHQLAELGDSYIYGFAMQPIDYDTNNNQLIAADIYDEPPGVNAIQGVNIYSITGSGASTVFPQLQFFDGSTIPDRTGQYINVYGVSSNRVGGKDYLALAIGTSPSTYAIDILVRPDAGLGDWDMY